MSSLPRTNGGARVLRACDAELLERATLTSSRSEVESATRVPAQETPLRDPVAEAYREGLLAGREEAENALAREDARQRREQVEVLAERLTASAEAIATSRRAVLEELLGEVGELIFALLRELVGEELSLREDPARTAVERALHFCPPDVDLVVHLNPGAAIAAWELESIAPGRRVRVVVDDSVEETGCLVQVGSATIDAQIGPALERLRRELQHLRELADLGGAP